MTTLRDVAGWLDGIAPPRLAETWDNVGLLWGDPAAGVERVMTCLTVTPRSAAEAVADRVDLIVSHHPVLFRGAKRVTADSAEHGVLWPLARAGVAVLSPHTAFDNADGGINDLLARRLGLVETRGLRPAPPRPSGRVKVVVFVPESGLDGVTAAAFAQGAGRVGAYEQCSFAQPGVGSFFGLEGSEPAVGTPGRRESVAELRAEFVCPGDRLAAVIAAVREVHPYEEPIIDAYALQDVEVDPGSGRLGVLPAPSTLGPFARRVGEILGTRAVQVVGAADRRVERVAVVCGAGDDFLADADRQGADVLLTGEARFHRAIEADARGIGLVVAGHHATERPGVEDLAGRIQGRFPGLDVWASRREVDPLWPAS